MILPDDQIKVVRDIMGSPYKINGRSKEEGFDCQTCTIHIQNNAFGRDVPYIPIKGESLKEFMDSMAIGEAVYGWERIDKPVHGCIVELCRGSVPHHCGTYFDLPQFSIQGLIHCLKGAGVIYDPWITLRAAGWRRFIYNVPRNS